MKTTLFKFFAFTAATGALVLTVVSCGSKNGTGVTTPVSPYGLGINGLYGGGPSGTNLYLSSAVGTDLIGVSSVAQYGGGYGGSGATVQVELDFYGSGQTGGYGGYNGPVSASGVIRILASPYGCPYLQNYPIGTAVPVQTAQVGVMSGIKFNGIGLVAGGQIPILLQGALLSAVPALRGLDGRSYANSLKADIGVGYSAGGQSSQYACVLNIN